MTEQQKMPTKKPRPQNARRTWPQVNARIHPHLDEMLREEAVNTEQTIGYLLNDAINEYFGHLVDLNKEYFAVKEE